MEELMLYENGFTGPLPEEWAKLSNLKKLYIQ
jgi:hypothetical protein